MAYAQISDLTDWLQSDLPVARADVALAMASNAVDGHVAEIGFTFAHVDTVDLVDTDRRSTVVLPLWPVTDVASIAAAGDLIDPSTWTWSRNGTLKRTSGSWPSRIEVTYTRGFAPSDLPDIVRTTVVQLAARMLANPTGASSESIGDLSRSWAQSLSGGSLTAAEERNLFAVCR